MNEYSVELNDGYGILRTDYVEAAYFNVEQSGVVIFEDDEGNIVAAYAPHVWRKIR